MKTDLGPLRRRDGEPLFAEPWQAQVMALAAQLVETGAITAGRWAETLGAEIKHAEETGKADQSETYYTCVLRSLERILQSENLLSGEALASRKEGWVRAYRATPHGQPVELSAGEET